MILLLHRLQIFTYIKLVAFRYFVTGPDGAAEELSRHYSVPLVPMCVPAALFGECECRHRSCLN